MSELNELILIFSQDEGTIDLNKGIIEALGRPKQVQIRLDEKTKQMMLRACDIEEEQAVVVQEADDAPQLGGRRLLKRIRNLAGWPDQEYLEPARGIFKAGIEHDTGPFGFQKITEGPQDRDCVERQSG